MHCCTRQSNVSHMLNVSICFMYALLYTTIAHYTNHLYACVYMFNVCIVVHTIECVNTLTTKTIYMLNVSTLLYVCIVVHDNRMCEHAYDTNHLYA